MIKKVLFVAVVTIVLISCSSTQSTTTSTQPTTETTTKKAEVIPNTAPIPDVNNRINKVRIQREVE